MLHRLTVCCAKSQTAPKSPLQELKNLYVEHGAHSSACVSVHFVTFAGRGPSNPHGRFVVPEPHPRRVSVSRCCYSNNRIIQLRFAESGTITSQRRRKCGPKSCSSRGQCSTVRAGADCCACPDLSCFLHPVLGRIACEDSSWAPFITSLLADVASRALAARCAAAPLLAAEFDRMFLPQILDAESRAEDRSDAPLLAVPVLLAALAAVRAIHHVRDVAPSLARSKLTQDSLVCFARAPLVKVGQVLQKLRVFGVVFGASVAPPNFNVRLTGCVCMGRELAGSCRRAAKPLVPRLRVVSAHSCRRRARDKRQASSSNERASASIASARRFEFEPCLACNVLAVLFYM